MIPQTSVPTGPLHVLIDSTGLQVYGVGQWLEAKHGTKSCRTWRKLHLAGNDGGAHHWAVAMTLIQTAKLNGVEPMAYLTDVLERVVSGRTKASALHTLLPWNWAANTSATAREA